MKFGIVRTRICRIIGFSGFDERIGVEDPSLIYSMLGIARKNEARYESAPIRERFDDALDQADLIFLSVLLQEVVDFVEKVL